MALRVRLAKLLMNLLPQRPCYQEQEFIQEIFRHPRYLSRSDAEKKRTLLRLVENNLREGLEKPLDLYFPSHSLGDRLRGKQVLDLGCSIGGKTIAWAQRWQVARMTGVDFSADSIAAADAYLSAHSQAIPVSFVSGSGERLPFDSGTFDAIVSHDTLEHVRSVKQTLAECKRVLKKDGVMFLVFPSYHFPFGGAHLTAVTRTPFLEWFFAPAVLNEAYEQIVATWDEEFNWFKPPEVHGDWSVVNAGIGINGTTYRDFKSVTLELGLETVRYSRVPLLFVSNVAIRFPIIRALARLGRPLLSLDCLKDYLSHRMAFVIEKT